MALPLLLTPFFPPVLPLRPFLLALTALFVCCILHCSVLELLKSSSLTAASFLGEQPSPLLQEPLLQGILVVLPFLPPLCYLPTSAARYLGRLSNTQELYANVSTLHLQLHWLCFAKGVSPERSGPKPGQHEVLSLALRGLFGWEELLSEQTGAQLNFMQSLKSGLPGLDPDMKHVYSTASGAMFQTRCK